MAGPYEVPDIAGGFYRGMSGAMQDAQALRQNRQMMEFRRQQAEREAQAAEQQAAFDRLKMADAQYGMRGQILGTVETPEDYARVMPEIKRLGLPTADLPEAEHSTAWQTFRKPVEPAKVGGWLPQQWFPDALPQAPAETAPMPTGPMRGAGIAPDDIPAVQRAAERGLPLQSQQKMKDADIGRQIQLANLARVQDKDALSREWMAFQREAKIQGMSEAKAQREFQRRMGLMGYNLDVAKFGLQKQEAAQRTAVTPKFTADQTNAATFGRRVEQGISDLDRVSSAGYDPTTTFNSAKISALVTEKPGAKLVAGPEERQTAQAYRNIINAILRRESGAAIAASEFDNAQQQYFPNWGDDPTTLAQKRRNLEQALAGLKTGAGAAWEATPSVIPEKRAPAKPSATGYKFTQTYQGVTYGRNSTSETWKRVK